MSGRNLNVLSRLLLDMEEIQQSPRLPAVTSETRRARQPCAK
jgi:hypothetical protein